MKRELDLSALSAWMDSAELSSGPIENATLLTGGSQNILMRFDRGTESFVLRRSSWTPRANADKTMLREARVLNALRTTKVPHPALVAVCENPAVLGAAFYLMAPVDGFTATLAMDDLHAGSATMRRRMGFAAVEGCAALGAVDYMAHGLEGFGNPDDYLGRQISRWRMQYASYSDYVDWPGAESLPGLDRIATWLDRHRPSTFRPGIMHGDYHLANIMFRHDSPEVAAIVDWELATIGDPLIDLAWLLVTWQDDGHLMEGLNVQPWEGFPSRDEIVAHYAAHSDRDLSMIGWYEVLAAYKFAIIMEGTFARAHAGQAERDVGDRLHRGALKLLDRALASIQ